MPNDRHSQVDSLGNPLTAEQINYFSNSKVRDGQGKLLVCYHGTSNPGFMEFDAKQGKSQFGKYKFDTHNVNYFTSDLNTARGYTEIGVGDVDGEYKNIYACYVNITNPYIVDNSSKSDMKTFSNIKDNRIREKQIKTFENVFKKWKRQYPDSDDIDNINRDMRPLNFEFRLCDDIKEDDPQYGELFNLHSLGDNTLYGGDNAVMHWYTLEEYFSDDNYEEMRDAVVGNYEEEYDDYFLTMDNIVKMVLLMNEEGENYDGIIIDDILDIGPHGSVVSSLPGTDIVTLQSSNQIKLITNKNPTSSNKLNEDSDRLYENYLTEEIINIDVNEAEQLATEYVTPSPTYQSWIDTQGRFIDASKLGSHYNLIDEIFWQLSERGKYQNIKPYELSDSEYNKMTDDILDSFAPLGWIQIGLDCQWAGIFRKPNSAQYQALEEYLDYASHKGGSEFSVNVSTGSDFATASYNLKEVTPEYVVSRIKRFFASGRLYENRKEMKENMPNNNNDIHPQVLMQLEYLRGNAESEHNKGSRREYENIYDYKEYQKEIDRNGDKNLLVMGKFQDPYQFRMFGVKPFARRYKDSELLVHRPGTGGDVLVRIEDINVVNSNNKLKESNELDQRAKKHKKKKEGLGWYMAVNPDKGNQKALDRFNNSTADGGVGEVAPMGEALERDTIILYYENLPVEKISDIEPSTLNYPGATNYFTDTVEYEYKVNKDEVVEALGDLITEEDYPEYDSATDEEFWKFIEDNFESLFDKYEKEILNKFADYAKEDWEEKHQGSDWEKRNDPYYYESLDVDDEPHICEKCGIRLTEGGECPVCEYGEEDILEESISPKEAIFRLKDID